MALIEVSGLTKSYGPKEVLRGVDLRVEAGEIVGILGPNGAGKTTTVECIGGLRTRDAGRISVDGIDPGAVRPGSPDLRRLRQILGMQLQECLLPGKITPSEAIDTFAAFYAKPRSTSELLDQFGLATQANAHFENLSGGQQQRLSVALALVGRPRVAILDELTTGLDPAARRDIWTYLEGLTDAGTAILLVTHSMEEAARLCDRIYIIDGGVVAASGTPDDLTGASGEQQVSFVASGPLDLAALRALPGVRAAERDHDRIVVTGDSTTPQTVLAALIEQGVTATQLRVVSPTLDDAYLRATGSLPTVITSEN